jgi:hypothetical protein
MNICSFNVTITNARNVREYCIIYSLQNIEMDILFLLEIKMERISAIISFGLVAGNKE